MSYDPNTAPRTPDELETCVNYLLTLEDEKAASDPAYRKKTREQLEDSLRFYLCRPEPVTLPDDFA